MILRSLLTISLLSLAMSAFSACSAQPEAENNQNNEPSKVSKGDSGMDKTDKAFIGLNKEKAAELAKNRGLRFRVVKEDGVPQFITKDLRQDRVSATVENGKITATKRQ